MYSQGRSFNSSGISQSNFVSLVSYTINKKKRNPATTKPNLKTISYPPSRFRSQQYPNRPPSVYINTIGPSSKLFPIFKAKSLLLRRIHAKCYASSSHCVILIEVLLSFVPIGLTAYREAIFLYQLSGFLRSFFVSKIRSLRFVFFGSGELIVVTLHLVRFYYDL
ncbi:hypothetical protein L6452_03574 [Arctium lappa]|uniref:Uncharacterized protein n=1 Tax=Arctium lappa TaxID=4217 RepID=A0ACB9FM16_ARCLA|nr:hypothetical protein L6452_03574 [Arctium lappa]